MEATERSNGITQNRQFPILHTLAGLYAELGKTAESRALLTKALETSHMAEPNSELWYGFGRLADIYGQYDAAIAAYKRVETLEVPGTFATYELVQQRIRELEKKYPGAILRGS